MTQELTLRSNWRFLNADAQYQLQVAHHNWLRAQYSERQRPRSAYRQDSKPRRCAGIAPDRQDSELMRMLKKCTPAELAHIRQLLAQPQAAPIRRLPAPAAITMEMREESRRLVARAREKKL